MASDLQDTISTWRAFTVWMNTEKSAEMNAILDAAEAGMQARDAALFLFKLLDDIDTAEDIAKSDDKLFRSLAHKAHRRRFKVAETDGHTVTLHALRGAA